MVSTVTFPVPNQYFSLRDSTILAVAVAEMKRNPLYAQAVEKILIENIKDPRLTAKASLDLGLLYLHGHGNVAKDSQKAIELLKTSQTATSEYTLAAIYMNGTEGVVKDETVGMIHLQQAAEKGHTRAQLCLGLMLWNENKKEQATTHLAACYLKGFTDLSQIEKNTLATFVAETPTKAEYSVHSEFSLLEGADAVLKPDLFRRYAITRMAPTTKNIVAKAFERMTENIPPNRSLTADEKSAICTLGRIIYNDENNPNYAKAVSYWQKAAADDCPQAQYYLGLAYCSGKGIKTDKAEGTRWLQKAADNKFLPAQAMHRYVLDREQAPACNKDEGPLKLASKEEEHCIRAQKNFINRVWLWIKDHKSSILITTISIVASAAIIGGLTILTIFFPHVMIPIWIGAGVIAGLSVGVGGFLMLGFAAGSGDRGAQSALRTVGSFL